MTDSNRSLFELLELGAESKLLLDEYKAFRLAGLAKVPTVNAEVSQLRSLAHDARIHNCTLRELLGHPTLAARLIEEAGQCLTQTTLFTRTRAFQNLGLLVLGEIGGRAFIEQFRAAIPKKPSTGWHDAGVSIPGKRNVLQGRAPTPDSEALESILACAISMSARDGAIAGLLCFSGLELGEISNLRWKDVRWQDEAGSTFCEIRVRRASRLTTCFVVADGAKALLSYALRSGLQREDYVFNGRKAGDSLSASAIRDRVRAICEASGWPGLTRSQLTAAFVLWLRSAGLDDHAIQLALGRRRAATVDRLASSAASIAAQRHMDQVLGELR